MQATIVPWFVAGPLIGLLVALLLLIGNRPFGVSSNFRHLCAAASPVRPDFLRYDWKGAGTWNLLFLAGILLGGFLGGLVAPDAGAHLARTTQLDLERLGFGAPAGLVPREIFDWSEILSPRGLTFLVLGGLLVGFGTAYAGGCTSGHGITGLADRQLPSLLAVLGFFTGGLAATHLLLPFLARLP